jgi:histidyl-tRNA synthetase
MEPRLVRGLDYYRRTTFEVTLPTLGAQSALLGGGRYDGLVQELGGPPVPGFGFAVGEDRLVMSLPADRTGEDRGPDAVAVILGEEGVGPVLEAARRLREAGMTVVVEPFPERSAKAQLRRANDLRAKSALLVGSSEAAAGTITVKRLADGLQKTVAVGDVAATLREMLHG